MVVRCEHLLPKVLQRQDGHVLARHDEAICERLRHLRQVKSIAQDDNVLSDQIPYGRVVADRLLENQRRHKGVKGGRRWPPGRAVVQRFRLPAVLPDVLHCGFQRRGNQLAIHRPQVKNPSAVAIEEPGVDGLDRNGQPQNRRRDFNSAFSVLPSCNIDETLLWGISGRTALLCRHLGLHRSRLGQGVDEQPEAGHIASIRVGAPVQRPPSGDDHVGQLCGSRPAAFSARLLRPAHHEGRRKGVAALPHQQMHQVQQDAGRHQPGDLPRSSQENLRCERVAPQVRQDLQHLLQRVLSVAGRQLDGAAAKLSPQVLLVQRVEQRPHR
eukprot:scaffold1102_cov256-Pinguiococcus_pyrenoidosus.AAC.45